MLVGVGTDFQLGPLFGQHLPLPRQQMNPVAVFHSAADYLRARRWKVPTYAARAGILTEAFRTVEEHLTTQLALPLTPTVRHQLDALFTTETDEPAPPHRPYRLTTLKRSLELMRPAAIRANVQDYAVLQALFVQVHPVVQALDLSEEVVRYYARYVERAQVFQVRQQADKKCLMVLTFSAPGPLPDGATCYYVESREYGRPRGSGTIYISERGLLSRK